MRCGRRCRGMSKRAHAGSPSRPAAPPICRSATAPIARGRTLAVRPERQPAGSVSGRPHPVGEREPCPVRRSVRATETARRAVHELTIPAAPYTAPARSGLPPAMHVWSTGQPTEQLPAVRPGWRAPYRASAGARRSSRAPRRARAVRFLAAAAPLIAAPAGRSRAGRAVAARCRRLGARPARAPAPSRAIVEVRAMSPLTSVGSRDSGSKAGAFARTCSHNARIAARPTVTSPGG
jgi:hypothetical protein